MVAMTYPIPCFIPFQKENGSISNKISPNYDEIVWRERKQQQQQQQQQRLNTGEQQHPDTWNKHTRKNREKLNHRTDLFASLGRWRCLLLVAFRAEPAEHETHGCRLQRETLGVVLSLVLLRRRTSRRVSNDH
jgi:hypothetical protein